MVLLLLLFGGLAATLPLSTDLSRDFMPEPEPSRLLAKAFLASTIGSTRLLVQPTYLPVFLLVILGNVLLNLI